MKTPTILITVLTVAAVGATPAVATAATGGPNQSGCPPFICGVSGNHNEVLAASIGA